MKKKDRSAMPAGNFEHEHNTGPDPNKAAPAKLTPMFAQYLGIKEQYPDALLFYRMGDFYELFFEDAQIAAKELQITLTSRNPGAETPVPMCGVPHHAVKSYAAQLLEKGFKIAVCEQVEDPKEAKGLVKRAVTHVLTPGTNLEESSLDTKGHSYLGALFWDADKGGGFAWVDYSTGEWSGLFSKREADLWQWVQKLSPRELLIPDLAEDVLTIPKSLSLYGIYCVRVPKRSYFDLTGARDKILKAQSVASLDALGLADKESLTRACGALLSYLIQTQKQDVAHLSPFVPLNLGRHLVIDEITERNLELFRRMDGGKGPGTLFHAMDRTMTPMGGRMLGERLRHPWRDPAPIRETQDAVDFFARHNDGRKKLRAALEAVYDLERLSTRISLNRAAPKDFVALRESIKGLAAVREALTRAAAPTSGYATADEHSGRALPPVVLDLLAQWDGLDEYAALLERSIADSPPPLVTEGGLFKQGYNTDLDELLDLAEHGEQKLQGLLEKEQTSTGISRLRLGYNRVFGHYFELARSLSDTLPERFIRRQTLANAERVVTPELKELEEKLVSASEKQKKLEYSLFQELREKIGAARPRIIFMAHLVAVLDYWQSLAEAARAWGWVRPELHEGTDIRIRGGRHPVVEAVQGKGGFVPNDLRMDEKRRLLLITGPNMAGKSTVLRQTALICLMAQTGSFVPADEASLGLCDRLFSRVGASDNLAQGRSTFMVEMMETARILRQVTPKSLVILDEIGRGTSTFDGMALAWAVVEDLVKRGKGQVRTLFATHYHELTSLEGSISGLHNMNIAVREAGGDIVFLRRLVPGPADRSYGIEVARLAGVPQPVVQRARQILETLEKSRSPAAKRDSVSAMRQLLPGFVPPETESEPACLPASAEPEHPLLTVLKDMDTNHLTPMKAFELVNEWKQLWGGPSQ